VDRAEFKRRNQAQMDRAKGGLQQVAREFVRLIAADAVEATPGFGNQHDNTEYIPTGRLRGGWNYTRTPIGQSAKGLLAGRTEEGPFSDYGRETVARIAAQLQADRMGGISYLENNVGYGHIIVMGLGNHAGRARNFPEKAATSTGQAQAARRAIQSLKVQL
jgi:hypothetical protein